MFTGLFRKPLYPQEALDAHGNDGSLHMEMKVPCRSPQGTRYAYRIVQKNYGIHRNQYKQKENRGSLQDCSASFPCDPS